MKIINNHTIQREPLLATIFNELDQLVNTDDDNYIINEWLKKCSHLGKKITFNYNNKLTAGVFKTINPSGQAVIENDLKSIDYNGAIEIL